MSLPEPKNPEHRANNAILCFCLGLALAGGAYFFGVGAIMAAALSGGDPVAVVGSVFVAIALTLLAICGFVLMLVGGVWMVLRVIADQRNEASEKRYRDVQR
jgi:membrane protein implicated in regulation of membrane protease activity